MTEFYHPKSGAARTIDEKDPSADLKIRALKRAGFLKGSPPAAAVERPQGREEVIPSTEGEEALDTAQGPTLAEHAPVLSNLQLPEGLTVEDLLQPADEEALYSDLFGNEDLSMKDLREIAKENDLVIPFGVRSKEDVAQFLRDSLEELAEEGDEEDAEEEGEGDEVDGEDEEEDEGEEEDEEVDEDEEDDSDADDE